MKRKFNVEEIKRAVLILGSRSLLAKSLNVSYQTVSDWLNERKSPSVDSCLKIEKETKGNVKAKNILLPEFDN